MNHGYTLIEMMLAVAISAVLTAIAVPNLKRFRINSLQLEAKSNLSQIVTLQETYYLDSGKYVTYGNGEYGNFYGMNPFTGEKLCTLSDGLAQTTIGANKLLGFVIEPCNNTRPNYAYQINDGFNLVGGYEAWATTGLGSANRLAPGCQFYDYWKINPAGKELYQAGGITGLDDNKQGITRCF